MMIDKLNYKIMKNISGLIVSGYCVYDLQNQNSNLKYSTLMIFFYSFVDIFFCDNILKMHHIFAILLTTFYFENFEKKYLEILRFLLFTELPFVFFNIACLLNTIKFKYQGLNNIKSLLKNINWILFTLLFFKCRIFDYNLILIKTYNLNYNFYTYISVLFPIYGLYILNIYWGMLIIQKIIKKVFKISC